MNRQSDILNKFRNAASAILTFAALSGCAAIGNPDGGAFDEQPPRITGTSPKMESTGFKGHKVTIDFNEFIKLENASEKVVISPPQNEQPEIKTLGKRIQVELFDTLIPNTTYSIDFADGIVDNNEGNPLGDFCFRFSTGDNLDTLEVSGYVLNAANLEPLKGMTVGLHSDLSDSAFYTKPFERVSRTDASGHFTVRGIAPGKYRIYAVKDMDQTFSYSQRNEIIAWMDSVIVPSSEQRFREDTIYTEDGRVDTTVSVQYTLFTPNDITLLAFTPQPNIQYMKRADRTNHEKFSLSFALPLDSMPMIRGLNFNDSDAYYIQHSERYDSLIFWLKDSNVYYMDTLSLSVTYMASDSTGQMVETTDSLNLVPKKSRQRILNELARKEEEESKARDKELKKLEKKGDTLGMMALLKPKEKFLQYRLDGGSSVSVYKDIRLIFEEPVTFLSDTAIHVFQKVDTVFQKVPFEVEQDSLMLLGYTIYAEWKPGQTFMITVDSASIRNMYGLYNEPLSQKITFAELNKFSTLTVNVANPKPSYVVRLLDSKGSVTRTGTLEDGAVTFYLLNPGKYYVSMLNDINGNGRWDTGEYDEKRQAEEIWYINKEFNLKQDWFHETDSWDIRDTKLTEQKPAGILKAKNDKKKVDVHKKNVERLEKKAQQIQAEKDKKERKKRERIERRQNNKEKYSKKEN